MKVFDAHFHIGAFGRQSIDGRPIEPISESDDHVDARACSDYLDRHGIAGGVIVPTYLERQEAAFEFNDLVLEAVDEDSRLVGGLWVSPLPKVRALLEATLENTGHPAIRALKIASNTWQPHGIHPDTWSPEVRTGMDAIIETAVEHDLIIHCHTGYLDGSHPQDFEPFLSEFGLDARFQLVHMGEAIAPAFQFVPRFLDWIKRGFQVYTDTSIVPGFGPVWLVRHLEKAGVGLDRVMFATDSPWGLFQAERAKITGLPVDDEVKHAILYANAHEVYRL